MEMPTFIRRGFWVLMAACVSVAAADDARQRFVTTHVATVAEHSIPYVATVEDFLVDNKEGRPGARLYSTSYVRTDVQDGEHRPVIVMFNGGPTVAAIGLHLQFGPLQANEGASAPPAAISFVPNPHSLLDVADLVIFDPAETGFSRVLTEADKPYFYSTQGDCESLAQLVTGWLQRHGRSRSPVYLLGESYGSIRQVVAGSLLMARSVAIRGQIILGDSIFLMETSRRTHNIVSSAVSLPLLAMTAAYHGKVDKRGKSDAAFLDEVYSFAMGDYLSALAKGYTASVDERRAIATRLEAYTSIPAQYFLEHGLTIAKQDFNRRLLPGQLLNANDTRVATPLPPAPKNAEERQKQQIGNMLDPYQRLYTDYMANELKVSLPGLDYRISAPGSFETWDWGPGCSSYLQSAALCDPSSVHPSIFVDYDWPELLKQQFERPEFRTLIIAAYYDGLSSIGTHRYLAAQLGYPPSRFTIREYPAGHMTAADPDVRPRLTDDIRKFLNENR